MLIPDALLRPKPAVAAVLALTAGTLWSFGGITVRLAPDSDSWQYLVWRSVGLLVAVEATAVLRGRGLLMPRFVSGGLPGWIGAAGLSLAAIAFVYALKVTTIANAIFLASITPLLSLVLGRIILKEPLTPVSIIAIMLAGAGLLVMVGGDMGGGSLVGNAAALLSSVGFAAYSICVRIAPGRDFTPALAGTAAMTLAVCAAVTVVSGRTLVPPAQDIAMALLHGAVFIGVGVACFNLASPVVPAVGLVVLAQTEAVFSPVWGWLLLGETPALTTLAGGALILTGVIMTAIAGLRPSTQ